MSTYRWDPAAVRDTIRSRLANADEGGTPPPTDAAHAGATATSNPIRGPLGAVQAILIMTQLALGPWVFLATTILAAVGIWHLIRRHRS